MKEKEVSQKKDLMAHITQDWKIVHRIWNNVLLIFESVFDSLWRDNTNDDAADVYFQSGLASVPVGSDVTVTFDTAYTVAPRVVASATGTTEPFVVNCHTIGTSSFKMRGVQWDNGSGSPVNCSWIAVGRKAR